MVRQKGDRDRIRRLEPETRERLLIAMKRHYELVHHYRAPWDRAMEQVCDEFESGDLDGPEDHPAD